MTWKVTFVVYYNCREHIEEDMKRIHDPPSVILGRVEIENIEDEVPAPETG